jgi:DNA-binding SARP family transcriptional activator
VQFRVLGEIAVVDDQGVVTPVTASRPRALLALLLLNPNRSMGYAMLAGALWGESQPDAPYAALQVVVSRLRSRLGEYGERVQAHSGGYRLVVAENETDLAVAQLLLQEGRVMLDADPSRAVGHFERALALWTGEPLDDLAELPFAVEGARRIRELWLDLVEARNDAVLRSGRHLEVLAGIDALIESEPLREHLRAQQIAALYRAGRQADALRACEALRTALRDELGVEPSAEIVELERRVLDQDPSLLPTAGGFMTRLPAWTTEVLPFVGRGPEYRRVLTNLAQAVEDEMRLVVVEGAPGVGKSRFLLQVARRIARDAIVIPVHLHDVYSSAIYAFARVLAEATLSLSDSELRMVMKSVPGVPNADMARVREVCRNLAAGMPPREVVREDALMQGAARWISALSGKNPVVLVVDDLDDVGDALLHVIWQLSILRTPRRVLVVGSVRSDRAPTPMRARALAALERRHLLQRIELAPLEPSEIEELLERMHVERIDDLVAPLYDLTGGNPFLIAEALSMGSPERIVDEWACPPQVQDVVRQRLAELGHATAELLMLASLFSRDFTVEVLADAADASVETVRSLVDRAVAAQVLQPSTLRSYRFAHQLFRHALVSEQTGAQAADGHRRIALALERAGASPSLLAQHWSGSDGPEVPAQVAKYARIAGREALRLFEPHAAVRWFTLALDHLPEAERGAGLADLAEAQQFVGDPDGHVHMQQAADIALATGDDDLVLRIIRATAPGWTTLPKREDDHGRLLERALEVVRDDATRARILARKAIEISTIDSLRAEQISEEAVALARSTRDRSVLYETLLRTVTVSQAPHTLDLRRQAVKEMFDIGLPPTDVATRFFSLAAALVVAIESCDPIEVERLALEMGAIAGSYDLAPVRWSMTMLRAWRAGVAGEFDRAEKLVDEARDYGVRCAISGALDVSYIQRGELRWQQGRLVEMLNFSEAAYAAVKGAMPGVELVHARVLVECERYDDARAVVADAMRDGGLDKLRRGPMWSSALVITAETACLLGLPEIGRKIRDELEPYADQVAFTGSWVTAPVAYGVGLAMASCDDPGAVPMLERAADVADRLGAPVLAALAREAPLERRD